MMISRTRPLLAFGAATVLLTAACGSSTTDDGTVADDSSTASASADPSTAEQTDVDPTVLFDEDALTEVPAVVDCTLSTGTETTCYQYEVASLASTVDSDGPYCPETTDDVGGIWVWDGDDPGLYALDGDFWTMMSDQGYDFVNDGSITVTDPGAQSATSSTTANSCLEATADGSFHLQVLIPTTPETLDTPTGLGTVGQVGLALDGVTIFADAPSVADRGGLPALDACGGHVDPSGYYHWHFGAESIQTNLDEAGADVSCDITQDAEALVGFAYDGYAIYGPEEHRSIPDDLDECSGHVSETEKLGTGYHYHLTYGSPNLPTCLVGAKAQSALSSPDNADAALPGDSGAGADGGGPPGGAPPAGG